MRRNSIPDSFCTKYVLYSFCDFKRKACAILQTTAVLICSMVGAVSQELVQQIAVGAMNFDTVKASRFCILGSYSKLIDDVWNLFEFESAGHPYLLLSRLSMNITVNRKCRWCNGYLSSMKIRM